MPSVFGRPIKHALLDSCSVRSCVRRYTHRTISRSSHAAYNPKPHSQQSLRALSAAKSSSTLCQHDIYRRALSIASSRSPHDPKVTTPSSDTTSSKDLALYPSNAIPPTTRELKYADRYFTTGASAFELSPIFSFRNFPRSEVPEVTVLGRSNVGKSSLLNALLQLDKAKRHIADVSKKPGRTKSMNAISLHGAEYSYKQKLWYGKKALVLVDMPGYGFGSRQEWGSEIMKYLTRREQLGMRFLLIDALEGIQPGDRDILSILIEQNLPFSLILSKVDKIIGTQREKMEPQIMQRLRERLQEIQGEVGEIQNEQRGGLFHAPRILGCSAEPGMAKGMTGLDVVRWAMLESTKEWNEKMERQQLRP